MVAGRHVNLRCVRFRSRPVMTRALDQMPPASKLPIAVPVSLRPRMPLARRLRLRTCLPEGPGRGRRIEQAVQVGVAVGRTQDRLDQDVAVEAGRQLDLHSSRTPGRVRLSQLECQQIDVGVIDYVVVIEVPWTLNLALKSSGCRCLAPGRRRSCRTWPRRLRCSEGPDPRPRSAKAADCRRSLRLPAGAG